MVFKRRFVEPSSIHLAEIAIFGFALDVCDCVVSYYESFSEKQLQNHVPQ